MLPWENITIGFAYNCNPKLQSEIVEKYQILVSWRTGKSSRPTANENEEALWKVRLLSFNVQLELWNVNLFLFKYGKNLLKNNWNTYFHIFYFLISVGCDLVSFLNQREHSGKTITAHDHI